MLQHFSRKQCHNIFELDFWCFSSNNFFYPHKRCANLDRSRFWVTFHRDIPSWNRLPRRRLNQGVDLTVSIIENDGNISSKKFAEIAKNRNRSRIPRTEENVWRKIKRWKAHAPVALIGYLHNIDYWLFFAPIKCGLHIHIHIHKSIPFSLFIALYTMQN